MKATGASADGVQSPELHPARLAPKYAGGDVLNVRHRLRRQVDLEADASVDLLAAGERQVDALVGEQRQAAAGTVSDDAKLVEQLVAEVVRLIHDEQRLAVAQAGNDRGLRCQRRAMLLSCAYRPTPTESRPESEWTALETPRKKAFDLPAQ